MYQLNKIQNVYQKKSLQRLFFTIVGTEETFDEIFALLYDCYTNITLMSETDEKYHKELYKEYKL